MANPRFILKNAGTDQYMFNLTAKNGQIILTSQRYSSKDATITGIESVKENSQDEEMFDKLISTDNKPYFVLKAKNHQVIGNSEMYESTANRDNGINSVMENAPVAEIDDQTQG